MSKKLVLIKNETILTTTKIISEETEVKHQNILQLFRRHEESIKHFGVIMFETWKPEKGSKGGRPETLYYLNEEQLTFFIMLMSNNKKVIEFKININKEFFRMKEELLNKGRSKKESFEKICRESIECRLKQTGAIKRFIEYAIESGSTNYKKSHIQNNCYATFTEYAYKCYFDNYQDYKKETKGLSKEEKNLKENLRSSKNIGILIHLSTIETMISNIIDREIKQGTYYKEINNIVPKELKSISSLIGKNSLSYNKLKGKDIKQLI